MKALAIFAAASLALLPIFAFKSTAVEHPAVGTVAPEIEAQGWYNHLGPQPSLESFRGQTVLVEFWATWCPPCVAAWPHLQELHEEYESKGLVILGLSAEEPGVVGAFVDDKGITARVAYGATSSGKYGIEGIPKTFLIAPDGKIAWHGHPSELNKGILEEALKGAKPRTGGPLALPVAKEYTGRVSGIAQSMAQGKLAKALQSATAISADAKATEAERADAQELASAIEGHVKALSDAADKAVASKDVQRAITLYELISKEFGAHELGTNAKSRIDGIRKDPALARELDAAEAFSKLRESTEKLASSKRKDKYREFAEKWAGTKAGDRAKAAAAKKD